MSSKKTKAANESTIEKNSEVLSKGFWSWLIPCFVTLATLLAFLPELQNGFVNGDDPANILDNPHYRGLGWTELRWMFTTFHLANYRPLTWVTLGLDYLLWGMNPFGYHLTSLFFHTVNAILFYFVALRLLGLTLSGPNGPSISSIRVAAGFSALIFALHPLRVEPVAWVSARNHVLSGLFFVSTILSYLRATRYVNGEGLRWRWLTASLIFYGLSLLSQPSGITLPFVLLVLDVYPLKRLDLSRDRWLNPSARLCWEKLPFFILACGAFLIGVMAKGDSDAVATLKDYGLLSRLNQVLYSLSFYIWKTVFPMGLSPLYEKLSYISETGSFDIRSAVIVLSLTLVLFLRRKRWPAGLASWICYGLILVPVVGLVPFGPQIVADRYSYLACLGWAILAGAGALYCRSRMNAPSFGLIKVLGALILVTLGILTWKQSQIWHDSERLWRHALSIDERTTFAHNLLALALADQGELQQTIQHLRAAVRIDPGFAEAHNNLGYFLAKRGSSEEAIEHYRQAILIKPAYADAHNNLGNALADRGELKEAVQHLRQALQANPEHADAFYNLGRVFVKLGNLDEALAHYRQALRFKPADPDIHNNLGLVYVIRGELDRAVDRFQEALKFDPNYAKAHFNLGRVRMQQGRIDQAVRHFDQAVRLHPDAAEVHENLARALTMAGKKEQALEHYQEALRLMKSKNQILPSPRAEGR